jgi:hypothetical protein
MGKNIIHYISIEFNNSFIIAKTYCCKHWEDINEFTGIKECVTCKKCLNEINKMESKK